MEAFSALLALCAGNSPVTGEFPSQRPETRSLDVIFHLRLNIRLSKQSWGWWFKTPSSSLWRHCNVFYRVTLVGYQEAHCWLQRSIDGYGFIINMYCLSNIYHLTIWRHRTVRYSLEISRHIMHMLGLLFPSYVQSLSYETMYTISRKITPMATIVCDRMSVKSEIDRANWIQIIGWNHPGIIRLELKHRRIMGRTP